MPGSNQAREISVVYSCVSKTDFIGNEILIQIPQDGLARSYVHQFWSDQSRGDVRRGTREEAPCAAGVGSHLGSVATDSGTRECIASR
jgi:hypothetical protein